MKSIAPSILELVEMFPFVTTTIIAKHLKYEYWVKDHNKSLVNVNASLDNLYKKGRISKANIQVTNNFKIVVYRRKHLRQGEKAVSFAHFPHDQAVISVLMGLWMNGYDVRWGGQSNCDGVINGTIALEVDRGNHNKTDLEKQAKKYDEKYSQYEKILYVSHPRNVASEEVFEDGTQKRKDINQEIRNNQLRQQKRLRKRIQAFSLPRRLKDKLYFATYADASDSSSDPLKEKVWQTLGGTNTTVL